MKHKSRRAGPNPLSEYRRLQREIRQIFDPFTAQHCPTCVTPCCVKPTRVTPIDVALAIGMGHTFPHLGVGNAYAPSVAYAGNRLVSSQIVLPMLPGEEAPLEPCEYLHQCRCTFPNDLRPYGCTTYLCGPMYAHLPEETLRRLRRLIRQLEDVHTALLRALRDAGKMPAEE